MSVTLISFGFFEPSILKRVKHAVEQEFRQQVFHREAHIDLSEFYDASRRQYHADKILKIVSSQFVIPDSKFIGLLQVDLYIPILTYIFGQAELNGTYAIASIYRLNNALYGLKQDDERTKERFTKEIVHELGHTFGLIHCKNQSCVMRSSTYVEDIDQKSTGFCASCREFLNEKR